MVYTEGMYVGVDVGGTKTLVAVLTDDGVIKQQAKFPTPKNYHNWLLEVRHALAHFDHKDFKAGGVGVPATVMDRRHRTAVNFSNLPWRNVRVADNLEDIFKCPFVIENDAKMAALSEYMLARDQHHSLLYITVSTGIGTALVVDGQIDDNVGDAGGRSILLEHRGRLMPWEDFAGGRAIVARYGKMAKDITDKDTWRKICRDLAPGLIELIAITQPELIVVGGSVGSYFERFGSLLRAELKKYDLPLIQLPKLKGAERPETAVIYGCYDLAKQTYGKHYANAHP